MKINIIGLAFIDKRLRQIAHFAENLTGWEPTVTSLYRMDDAGVHGQLPLRGIDLRMRNIEIGKRIAVIVNERWQYDFNRPDMKCAIIHGIGAKLHLHLQTHPNTRRRS